MDLFTLSGNYDTSKTLKKESGRPKKKLKQTIVKINNNINGISFEEFKLQTLKNLQITPAEQKMFATGAMQKGPAWFEAKEKRLTSSQFGAAAQHNTYSSRSALLKDKLWPKKFSSAATEYGSTYEEVCRSVFEKFMQLKNCKTEQARQQVRLVYKKINDQLLNPNANTKNDKEHVVQYDAHDLKVSSLQVVICLLRGWLGFSPDGVVEETNVSPTGVVTKSLGGLEIKCPSSKKIPITCIPHAHYDQVQQSCAIAGWKFYYYVVYHPRYTLIRKLEYDEEYATKILYPKLEEFYMNHYLKSLYWKFCGKLEPDQTQPAIKL